MRPTICLQSPKCQIPGIHIHERILKSCAQETFNSELDWHVFAFRTEVTPYRRHCSFTAHDKALTHISISQILAKQLVVTVYIHWIPVHCAPLLLAMEISES